MKIAIMLTLILAAGTFTACTTEEKTNNDIMTWGCRNNSSKKKNRVARKGCPVSAFYSII